MGLCHVVMDFPQNETHRIWYVRSSGGWLDYGFKLLNCEILHQFVLLVSAQFLKD